MKIKLAMLEQDKLYLKRVKAILEKRYADKLEVYTFSELEIALENLKNIKVDLFLADESFDIEHVKVPPKCGVAYLVDSPEIKTLNGKPAICKFQKCDLLYKQMLNLYAENAPSIERVQTEQTEGTRIIGFFSPSGGTGCSTAAAACAVRFASQSQKVLYLNLELLGDAEIFFHGEGTGDFGDIIYALKANANQLMKQSDKGEKKGGNLAIRLESLVRQDSTGVHYYAATKLALDMQELTGEELRQLLEELRKSGGYDAILLDLDFSFAYPLLQILSECDSIVMVSDGSAVTNQKLERAVASLGILEQQEEKQIQQKMCILYNRFSTKTSQMIEMEGIKNIGGIKRFEGYQPEQLIKQLANQSEFDVLR